MNREFMKKPFRAAVWIVLPGAIISFTVCCLLLFGGSLPQAVIPVGLTVLFGVVAFVLGLIPGVRRRMWLRVILYAAAVVAAVVLLKVFC